MKDQSSPPPKCGSPGPARWHQHMVKLYERTLTGFQSHLRTFQTPRGSAGFQQVVFRASQAFILGEPLTTEPQESKWQEPKSKYTAANISLHLVPVFCGTYSQFRHKHNFWTAFFCPKRRAKILIKLNIYFFSDGSALFRQQDHNFTMCH